MAYNKTCCMTILYIFPLTLDNVFLLQSTPDIFLQLFHPDCILGFTFASVPPSFCMVLPRYLNWVTSTSCVDGMLSFQHMCSVIVLETFMPTSQDHPPANPCPWHTPPHCLHVSFATESLSWYSVRASMMMTKRCGLRAETWWNPIFYCKAFCRI